MKKEKVLAVVTINEPKKMSREQRHELAKWLRREGSLLLRSGDKMATRYTGRYIQNPAKKS